jgi:hypothetical protein
MNEESAFVQHIGHDQPVESCMYCEVRPLLKRLYDLWWSTGTDDQRQIMWEMQDGYGAPGYTPPQGYDWSGIRDSEPATIMAMYLAVEAAA